MTATELNYDIYDKKMLAIIASSKNGEGTWRIQSIPLGIL
jgi:hypothetical protein